MHGNLGGKKLHTIHSIQINIFPLKSYQGPIKKHNLNFKVLSQRRKNLRIAQYCAIVDYFEKRKVARPLNFKVLSQRRKNLRIAQYCATVDYSKKRKVARPFFWWHSY